MPRRIPVSEPLRSATGLPLTREVAFVFALDPTREQERHLLAHAGAARLAFNHHLARVKANLDQRSAERSYGIPDGQLTPALSWSKFSLINESVVADTEGVVLHAEKGVKALQHAQQALRRANKALARTKPGSLGRRKAKTRLTRIHARIAHLRSHTAHHLAYWAATTLTRLTVEDLNISGMTRLRSLARSVADAGMADLGRLLTYKARWYGCELVIADRWYPSSKTCSGCGHVKDSLALGERTYRCEPCGLHLDRDVNAAVNLARWSTPQTSPPLAAAA